MILRVETCFAVAIEFVPHHSTAHHTTFGAQSGPSGLYQYLIKYATENHAKFSPL